MREGVSHLPCSFVNRANTPGGVNNNDCNCSSIPPIVFVYNPPKFAALSTDARARYCSCNSDVISHPINDGALEVPSRSSFLVVVLLLSVVPKG